MGTLHVVFEESGQRPKLQSAGRFLMGVIGLFDATMRGLRKEKLYQFEVPWVVDHSKFVQYLWLQRYSSSSDYKANARVVPGTS